MAERINLSTRIFLMFVAAIARAAKEKIDTSTFSRISFQKARDIHYIKLLSSQKPLLRHLIAINLHLRLCIKEFHLSERQNHEHKTTSWTELSQQRTYFNANLEKFGKSWRFHETYLAERRKF
jgi:hypothetical protein